MDSNGIPMAYKLFPGNNNDCTTLIPMLSNIRQKYGVGKMAIVADKGMNTSKNVYYISNGRGWYIFSQKVRGGAKELLDYVLNGSGYKKQGDGFKIKSRQFTRHVKIEQENGRPPIEADISEKQVVFYSRDFDVKAKKDREKAIRKAFDIVKNPTKYTKYNTHGAAKYINHLEYDKETGEILQTKSKIQFNFEKLREDEKYDGYYLIVTNAFNKSSQWIIDNYRGLWEIEESFKISKRDLEARPVFMSRIDHIEAHFLTCFIALTIIRLLHKSINNEYSEAAIINSLVRACCVHMNENNYMAFYYDDILKCIGDNLGIDFKQRHKTSAEIRNMIALTKK
jgi:transposase